MLDLFELLFNATTDPVTTIAAWGVLLLLGGLLVFYVQIRGRRFPQTSDLVLLLRRLLAFDDADLTYNRQHTLSPQQRRRMKRSALLYTLLYTLMGLYFPGLMLVAGMTDPLGLVFMAFSVLLFAGLLAWTLNRILRDLRGGEVLAIPTNFVIEPVNSEYAALRFFTGTYKIVVRDGRLTNPLEYNLGFLPEAIHSELWRMNGHAVVLFVTPRSRRLLALQTFPDTPETAKSE